MVGFGGGGDIKLWKRSKILIGYQNLARGH